MRKGQGGLCGVIVFWGFFQLIITLHELVLSSTSSVYCKITSSKIYYIYWIGVYNNYITDIICLY